MQAKNEKKTTNQFKHKLISIEALISKYDKRNSTIIMYKDEYKQKSNELHIQQQIYCGW